MPPSNKLKPRLGAAEKLPTSKVGGQCALGHDLLVGIKKSTSGQASHYVRILHDLTLKQAYNAAAQYRRTYGPRGFDFRARGRGPRGSQVGDVWARYEWEERA